MTSPWLQRAVPSDSSTHQLHHADEAVTLRQSLVGLHLDADRLGRRSQRLHAAGVRTADEVLDAGFDQSSGERIGLTPAGRAQRAQAIVAGEFVPAPGLAVANQVQHSDLACRLHVPRRQLTYQADEQDRGDDPEHPGDHDDSDLVVELLGDPRVGVSVEPCDRAAWRRGRARQRRSASSPRTRRARSARPHAASMTDHRAATRIAALPQLAPHEVREDAERAASKDVDGDGHPWFEDCPGRPRVLRFLAIRKLQMIWTMSAARLTRPPSAVAPRYGAALSANSLLLMSPLRKSMALLRRPSCTNRAMAAGDDADDGEGDERLAQATDSLPALHRGHPGRRRRRTREAATSAVAEAGAAAVAAVGEACCSSRSA